MIVAPTPIAYDNDIDATFLMLSLYCTSLLDLVGAECAASFCIARRKRRMYSSTLALYIRHAD